MDFAFTSSHLNPFLYFGAVFVVALLISGTLSFVLGTIAFQSETISIIREDLKSFIGVTLLCAIVMTALSDIFYSKIILLEKAVTSGSDGFVEAEHVK